MKKIKMITYSCIILVGLVLIGTVSTPAYSNSFTDSIKNFFKVDKESRQEKTYKKQVPRDNIPSEKMSETVSLAPIETVTQTPLLGEEQITQKLVEEPNNVNYQFELGQLKILKGDIDGARNIFSQLSMMGDGAKLGLIGTVLVDLFLGQNSEAYKKMSQSSLSSDPEILVLSSWSMFLGGATDAADNILNNASKITNSRVVLGTLATFYAVTGSYDLAEAILTSLAQTGFLPAQALKAKFLINSKFGENKDAISTSFSELRNKYQLSEPVARMILGSGLMLELNYPKAAEQYEKVEEGALPALKSSAKRMSARIDDINDPLFVNYHQALLGLALKTKNVEFVKRILNVSPRAFLVLLTYLEDNPGSNLNSGNLDEFVFRHFGPKWFREKILSSLSDNSYIDKINSKFANGEKLGEFVWALWDYIIRVPFEEGKRYTDEDLEKFIDSIAELVPASLRPYTKFELYLTFYPSGLLLRGDFDKAQKYYSDPESFRNFFFSKVSKADFDKTPGMTQEHFERRIVKRLSQIAISIKGDKEFSKILSARKSASDLMELIRNNPEFTAEQARAKLKEINEDSCVKTAIEYYLSHKFNQKEASTYYKEYLNCISKMDRDEKSIDISAGIFIETLFNAKEYEALIKFYNENDSWLSIVNGYSAIHYIEALALVNGARVALTEAKQVCAKVEAEFCVKINTEILPEIERRHRSQGMIKASELVTKAGSALEKKHYEQAKSLLLEAKTHDPLNPFIYMYFEAIYRIDNKFDFLTQYTELISAYLTEVNIEPARKIQLQKRIFEPCESLSFPCETLVTVIRDGRLNDTPSEVLKPAYAAQLIRLGELEAAGKIVDEMTKSDNLMLQRKGLQLKASLTEILRRVKNSSSFDKKILQDIEKTAV